MIAAILIGREGSVAFPGKNAFPILGRPLMSYPIMAARNSKYVDEIYLSTDSSKLMQISREYGVHIIERTPELATSKALAEDAFANAYKHVRYTLKKNLELIVLLFCNSATILPETIDTGIALLRQNPELDSATTVSKYNMWSPIRARKINDKGMLEPFVPLKTFGELTVINCDRDSQGDVLFADMSASIVRPHCLDDLEYGMLPQRWMGQKIAPLIQSEGCDIDYAWQVPGVEHWLKERGFSETKTPYDKRD